MCQIAMFNIGDIVVHKRFGYRAVIIDVDPLFQPSGRFNPQALKRDFARRNPWYRLLVDGSTLMTYVEENTLLLDKKQQSINNPHVNLYLTKRDGIYHSISRGH